VRYSFGIGVPALLSEGDEALLYVDYRGVLRAVDATRSERKDAPRLTVSKIYYGKLYFYDAETGGLILQNASILENGRFARVDEASPFTALPLDERAVFSNGPETFAVANGPPLGSPPLGAFWDEDVYVICARDALRAAERVLYVRTT
jgi:hypothetical protein